MIHETILVGGDRISHRGELYTYFLRNSQEMNPKRKRPVVLICPGGGYYKVSDREAEPIAMQFLARGYHAALLRYSVSPVRYPEALVQLADAVRYLRENRDRFGIDPDRIILQGSSAGGHLAASLGVFWKREFLSRLLDTDSETLRPNGLILSYPVITSGEFAHRDSFVNLLGEEARKEEKLGEQSLELQVNPDTPPAFLWAYRHGPHGAGGKFPAVFPGSAPPPCAGGASYLSGGRPRPGAGKRGDKTGRRIWRSEAVPELDRSGGRVDERNITAQTERGGCKIMTCMMEQLPL